MVIPWYIVKHTCVVQQLVMSPAITWAFIWLYSGTSLISGHPWDRRKCHYLVRFPDFRGCNVHIVWDSQMCPVYGDVLHSGCPYVVYGIVVRCSPYFSRVSIIVEVMEFFGVRLLPTAYVACVCANILSPKFYANKGSSLLLGSQFRRRQICIHVFYACANAARAPHLSSAHFDPRGGHGAKEEESEEGERKALQSKSIDEFYQSLSTPSLSFSLPSSRTFIFLSVPVVH